MLTEFTDVKFAVVYRTKLSGERVFFKLFCSFSGRSSSFHAIFRDHSKSADTPIDKVEWFPKVSGVSFDPRKLNVPISLETPGVKGEFESSTLIRSLLGTKLKFPVIPSSSTGVKEILIEQY